MANIAFPGLSVGALEVRFEEVTELWAKGALRFFAKSLEVLTTSCKLN